MFRVSAGRPGAIIEAPSGQEEAELLAFDSSFTAKMLALAPEESLRADDWPIAPGVRRSVVLTRRDIYAPDARIVMMEGAREVELPRSRLAFFLGEIQDGTQGRVMVSIDPDTGTLGGFSATNEGYFEIVPPQGRRTGYLVASPTSLRKPGEPAPTWRCGQEELPTNWGNYTPRPEARQPLVQNPPTRVAVLAIDTDNEFMSQKFSDNTTNATNYIASLVASITTIYERDALVRIYEGYTILRVSTTPDPYTVNDNGNADGAELIEFGNYWNTNYGNVRRTVATILSGKQPGSSSASGIAWISGLCSSSYGYSFCQVFKMSYLSGDTLIVAHEMGHNFGSPHTHCYSPPADYCYNAESGCWSGAESCPTAYSITTASTAVVTGVTGTLMSYCHLLGGCEPSAQAQLVFHLRSLSEYLNSNISSASGCIFAIGNAAPTITSLSVTSGPVAGGTSTNITGTNFRSGATVAFANLTNSVGAASVTFNSSSSLTVHTPAHVAGIVDVVVMNPDFQTATLQGGFTYSSAPPPTTPSDYDGDGKADITVFRPSTGTWWTQKSSDGTAVARQLGNSTDIPVSGDYDGDGKADVAVFRPSTGTWWIQKSSNGTVVAQPWGISTDIPVPGDYDGDGKTDVAVYRPSTGTWWILRSSDGAVMARTFGVSTDVPVPGDYDGDGKTDVAIYRPSTGTWWILRSSDGTAVARPWGISTDIPVAADFDGDHKTDISVYRPSTGTWWILRSSDGAVVAQQWGMSTDIPVPGDYDGDGKTDVAVFRPSTGTWWILKSTDGTSVSRQWGVSTDEPVVGSPP
jgi:hypothetical protein